MNYDARWFDYWDKLEFFWSMRVANCLRGANVDHVDQLVTYTERDLLGIKNLGTKSLAEIKQMLALRGLSLAQSGQHVGPYDDY